MQGDDITASTALSAEELELLLYMMEEEGLDSETQQKSILPRAQHDDVPLSFAQERLWFIDQWDSSTAAYNLPFAARITGPLRIDAFERSLNEIVRRHEALRTSFRLVDGQPRQTVAPALTIPLPLIDLSSLPPDEQEVELRSRITKNGRHRFDLTRSPLLCAELVRVSEQEHYLLFDIHHIIFDGWSSGIFMREITLLYDAFVNGKPSPLPELPIQYPDFALWQREWLQGEVLEEQLSYWKRRLGGNPPVLELPTDYPRPAVLTYRGTVHNTRIPLEVVQGLTDICQQERATLFMALVAAFQTLLYRYTGQEDIVIGTPIANRDFVDIESLLGFFVNTLLLRADLSGNLSFREFLGRVRETTLEAYAHQDIPFEQLVEVLRPPRDTSHTPLFQVMFILQNTPVPAQGQRDVEIEFVRFERVTAKFDLTLSVTEAPEGLRISAEYKTDLFKAATIERMMGHYRTLLESIVADPDCTVSALPLLTAAEREQLAAWNATSITPEEQTCIHQLFEAQVERTPDALALMCEDSRLTYRELNRRANQLAHYLRGLGIRPEERIGLSMERSVELVVGVLGIFKAGGAYVPLDPALPTDRLEFMVEDAQVRMLLTRQAAPQPEAPEQRDGHDAVAAWFGGEVVDLLADWEQISQCPATNPGAQVGSRQLAYVIYTSGSVGKPKGVLIEHQSFVNYCQAADDLYGIEPHDRLLQFASINFDASAEEICAPLIRGATTVLRNDKMIETIETFLQTCEAWGLSVLNLPTAFWHELVARIEADGLALPPRLRLIIIGGERALPERVALWQTLIGGRVELLNAYGPTEATIAATFYTVPHQATEGSPREVPIGRPLRNLTAYVLDRNLFPVPVGVPGELCLGGANLARGYLNRPDLTGEKFVPDPFSQMPGARLYHSGDLVRWLPDGTMEFLGRVDHQVKIRGYRIEIGEIEAALRQSPALSDVVVMAREDTPGDKRLVAYIIPRDGHAPTTGELRNFLLTKIPDYMIPSAFVTLEQLPLTVSGKVNLRALPAPDRGRSDLDAEFVAPRTATEQQIAALWLNVLKLEQVGIYDNFFELGGHSLLATQLIARLRDTFHVDLPLMQLFASPTVAGLSAMIDAMLQEAAPDTQMVLPPIQPAPHADKLPLSFAQQRLWFLDQLEPGTPLYNIPSAVRMSGRLDIEALQRSFDAIVERHAALRTTFTTVDQQPVQVIAPPAPVEMAFVDLRSLPLAEREAAARRLADEEALSPFDLQRGPLLRVKLLQLEATEYVVLFTMHHIISDGWSISIVIRELALLYRAFADNQHAPLAPLPIQYADFAVWQRQWLQDQVLEQHLSYWKQQLADVPAALELPTDRPRPPTQTLHGAMMAFMLPPDLSQSLQALSQQHGATLFMTLLAAFQTLMFRYSGQTDIAIGSPIANRTRKELEGLIGIFVNTLVFRTDLAGSPTFVDLLGRVRRTALDAFAHQDMPFEQLVEAVRPVRDLSRSPLFQVMFALQNTPAEALELPGLMLRRIEVESVTAKFDLSLGIAEQTDGLVGTLEYNTDLFDHETIARMIEHFQKLLEGIVADPHTRIDRLPLLTTAEYQQLVVDWNATAAPFPQERCLHQLVEEQAARTPDAIAVVFKEETLTYAALNTRANQLAHYLRSQGVGPEVLVGIFIEPSPAQIVGLLGVLKAGGAYVPLDPAYPQERLAFLVQDSQAALVLTQHHLRERLPATAHTILELDHDWPVIAQQPSSNPNVALATGNLAYLIYTSGSTGRPKGALLTHRNIINHLTQQVVELTAADAMLQCYSINFDPSVWSIFWPLISGARLVLVPVDEQADSAALVRLMVDQQVTTYGAAPALHAVLVDEPDFARVPLRYAISGGEVLSLDLQHRFHARTSALLRNCYGPTEATIDSTAWICRRDDDPRPVPIGSPLLNVQAYVLDSQQQPVPIGVAGELYIGGVGVGRGYHHRPDLTAERFVPDPFSQIPGSRLYRTGDLARYRADGAIEYLGRIDQQIKLRGFRIELGEIEATLRQQAGVRDAVVVVREDRPGDQRLIGYVVPSDGQIAAPETLRVLLAQQLPAYMVPTTILLLDALPLNPNGKVDRKALPAPDGSRPDLEHAFVAPRTSAETLLVKLWSDVLGAQRIGVHDNFFDLGGHSLLATQLVSRVRAAFQIDLPLRQVFAAPTIAQMAALITTIRRDEHAQDNAPPLQPVDRSGPVPLSFSQERMWFLDQLEPSSPRYNIPSVLRVTGRLDIGAFEQSLDAIIRRHEILRTTFMLVEEQPVQVIAPPTPIDLPLIDLRHLPTDERESQARELARAEALTPFDLQRGPLLRVRLLQLAEGEHIVLFTMHHIISDGWSTSVLVRELGQLYSGFTRGEVPSLPPLPIQYADFAVWQRDWLQGEVLQRQLSYWQHQLGDQSRRGPVPLLDLPTDRPRPLVETYRGKSLVFTLPQPLADAISALCQREQATPFMTLLAAFQALLYRYSGQDDIAIGTPIANRNRQEIEPLIGCFINTLVLRTDLSGAPSFRELLDRVRQSTLEAYDHQDLPFEVLVDSLHPTRQLSYNPLFQVMFVLQNTPAQALDLPDAQLSPVSIETGTTKTDLALEIVPNGEGFTGGFTYNTDLFDDETIARMQAHFLTLLESIVADPAQPIDRLPLLTEAEQQQSLIEWNRSETDYPRDAAVHQMIEAQVARTPDRTAIVFESAALTYAELNTRANQLAHFLRTQGVGPDVLVALYVERSLEMIVGMLAILKAGGAYLPLDPAYPAERLQYMLSHSQAPVIVTQAQLVARLPEHTAQVFRLDADWHLLAEQPTSNPSRVVLPDNLAYVIYTSGSTGRPKGVMVKQQGLINLVYGLRASFDDPAVTTTGLITSISFDISVNQIFPTLIFGRTLHIIPDPIKFDSRALLHYLDEHQVHLLDAVPSYIQAVLNEIAPEQAPNALRYFLIGGEKLEQRLLQSVFGQLGAAVEIVNIYGLTEISDINILGSIRAEDVGKPITAGTPLQNNRIYILDAFDQPQPIGIAGEICVSGESVSRGYLFRPELTAERFVVCPFEDSQIMVRTGDLGRWRPDGTVEIMGRIDHQVKVRGFRIETGEIEHALAQHPSINECVVVVREDAAGDKRLVAYVVENLEQTNKEQKSADVSTDDCSLFSVLCSPQELREFLAQRLPDYMVPAEFVALPALPKTPNGKIDRKALPVPSEQFTGPRDTFVAPRDTLELRLARIWEELLDVPSVGIHDNFFELGGHSLLVVRLMAQLQRQIGQKIPLATLFQKPTVEHLAYTLRQLETRPPDSPLILLQSGRDKLPFFCVHPVAGSVLSYLELARRLGPDQPFYGLQARGLDGDQPPQTEIETMAAEYLAAVREAQPEGPYLLGGWSFGGLVAYEMARQLTGQGQEVALLAVIDRGAPEAEAAPEIDQTRLLAWFANDFGRSLGVDLPVSIETLAAVPPEQQLAYVLEQAHARGVLPADLGERELSAYIDVFTANLRAIQAYQPQPYPGRVTLFRAGDRPLDETRETLGWEALAAEGVSVRVLPGDHYTIVRQPHVAALADELSASIEEAQTLRETPASDG